VSTKNQIVVLLQKLQAEHGCSYMLISHDLPIVRHIRSRIAVMYAGRIVEQGAARRVVDRPAHPHTMALVSASPYPNPARERARPKVVLTGSPFRTLAAENRSASGLPSGGGRQSARPPRPGQRSGSTSARKV
jgi:ABC-type oligopeptide transport system ATPase subunit